MNPLDPVEIRVLGCLVEKELATPDYYPLSLNALVNACNQKSNRDPVVAYDEDAVVTALDSLRAAGLATRSAEGGRTAKFCHNLDGKLRLDPAELAVLAELLLRGAQTAGELRQRASRMVPLPSLAEVESVLEELQSREDPLVMRLPRQPGRKEPRFIQLLAGEPLLSEDEVPSSARPGATSSLNRERLDETQRQLDELRQELAELRQEFQQFREEFE